MKSTDHAFLIPDHLKRPYITLRILLYAGFLAAVFVFADKAFFPTLEHSFNFRTPGSSRNNLLDPRTPDGTPRTNGQVETSGTLIVNAGVVGDFSTIESKMTLESKSALPESVSLSVRRSYRSFLLPTGSPIAEFPKETLFRIDGTFYALRDGTFFPFVSRDAFLSRYPEAFALQETSAFLSHYNISEEWLGFRSGTLVSFADGVFVITSDEVMRPIGSADIFLALGYRFEDVFPANEEELGIYKRGKIFLLGDTHPDGTLLYDTDAKKYYLVENGSKREVTSESYRDFLLGKQAPVIVSSISSEKQTGCALRPSFFGRTYSCALPLETLKNAPGTDYEMTLRNSNTDIDISTLTVSFETARNQENFLRLSSQIKQRVLARLGLNVE